MQVGFGKQDITPRLGVELYGYSGYLNRYATAVRDRMKDSMTFAEAGTVQLRDSTRAVWKVVQP